MAQTGSEPNGEGVALCPSRMATPSTPPWAAVVGLGSAAFIYASK